MKLNKNKFKYISYSIRNDLMVNKYLSYYIISSKKNLYKDDNYEI
jgi:hypothetical protein